jgi:hypothetical protein
MLNRERKSFVTKLVEVERERVENRRKKRKKKEKREKKRREMS